MTMKNNAFLYIVVLITLFTTACSADEAAFVNVNNDTPLSVTESNPIDTVTIQGVDSSGNPTTPQVDGTTDALDTIEIEHTFLHEGRVFSLYDVNDIPNSGNRTLSLLTPALPGHIHIIFDIESESEAEWDLYEDNVNSNNGTLLTAYNRNRDSLLTATMVVTHTPTITSLGTLIANKHWGSGKGVGGGERATDEWMLKPSTRYLVRVRNFVTTANHATIKMTWYK